MKKITTLFITFLLGASSVWAGQENWLTDFEKAKAESAARHVPILADFAGSDWCGWCIRLDKEVFSTPEFEAYAKDHLVLLLVDFPNTKKQSDAVKKQNEALAEKYGIKGFPSVRLLDSTGKVLGATGYQKGGPIPYIEQLKSMLK